jgi:hypothetical protein
MKIYQVISEVTPPAQKASARLQAMQATAQANAQATAKANAPAAAKAAAQTAWDQTKNAPQPLDPKTGKPMKGLTAPTDLQRSKHRRMSDADYKKFREKVLANKKFSQTALGKWQGKFGNTVRTALGALQLAGSCIELYTVRAAADEYEAEGLLSPENSQIMRDYALRKFTVEVAAQIALWAGSAIIARGLVTVVRALMLTFGIATGGAGLAALVASEIAMQAFLAYIKTEQGREVFARYLAGVLIDDDSMVGSVTKQMLDYIGMSTKVPGEKQKVSGLPTSNNQTATA